MTRRWLLVVGCLSVSLAGIHAQVTSTRLLRAAEEPQNWLMYSGGYTSHRYSTLSQINPSNVKNLEIKWILQADGSLETWQTTPLVVNGIMYLTSPVNDVFAIDAATGRAFWQFHYAPSTKARGFGMVNRGLAILGNTLYLAALDNYLIALDATNGRQMWKTLVADVEQGFTLSAAPLVVGNKVLVGITGGDGNLRGFLAAYDAHDGTEKWRFQTIPNPGERGGDTWETAYRAGGGTWLTGSYDPELNLIYWGTGNPWPYRNDDPKTPRKGDNLYTDSVVALDAETGRLKWHFQFTPGDTYDFDANQVPVLVDAEWRGQRRKLMYWANRNGFFYVLDRTTGEFLSGHPFVKVNWASGLDPKGRPIATRQPENMPTYPSMEGGTNWYSPSYSPHTGLFYIPTFDGTATAYTNDGRSRPWVSVPGAPGRPFLRRGPINNWTEAAGRGAVVAFDPRSGEEAWKYQMHDVTSSGILTTASDLLFSGGKDGYFQALDARSGQLLWKSGSLGGQVAAGPVTFQAAGKQYVSVAASHVMFVFGLRDQ